VKGLPDVLKPGAVRLHKALLHSNLYSRYRAQFAGTGVRPESVKRYLLAEGDPPALAEEMLRHTNEELRKLASLCEQHEVELRAVVMHEPFQTTDKLWKFWVNFAGDTGAPPPGTPRQEATSLLVELLSDLGIESFNMSEELERMGADLDTFTVDERHWSPTGHRLMAYGIFARMRDSGLLADVIDRRAASPRPVPTKR
jgi:hypothetical protein